MYTSTEMKFALQNVSCHQDLMFPHSLSSSISRILFGIMGDGSSIAPPLNSSVPYDRDV